MASHRTPAGNVARNHVVDDDGSNPTRACRVEGAQFPARRSARYGACPSCSLQKVLSACDENAGATGLAPDALVARCRRTVIVVAGDELAVVDPQLAIEKMQLFDARMRMRRITRAGREAYQHADPVPFRVSRAAC